MSRGNIRDHVADFESAGMDWPRDPEGAPIYPGSDRHLSETERRRRIDGGSASMTAPRSPGGSIWKRPCCTGRLSSFRRDRRCCSGGKSYRARSGSVPCNGGSSPVAGTAGSAGAGLSPSPPCPGRRWRKTLQEQERDTAIREMRLAGMTPADIARLAGFEGEAH